MALSKPSWTPPQTFDEHRLVEPLGRGRMGQVYLAHDAVLDRAVAVKFIASIRPDEVSRRRFQVEARAIARLSHPNVVVVHRVGEVDGRPYLVTELVRGTTLADLAKPVPWERALTIGLGLARGLAAAHRQGILHRDIKPANVMLTPEDEVKILDFGLAKLTSTPDEAAAPIAEIHAASSITGEGGLIGTPLYMASEVLLGEPASRRSDLYALGAVLHELCAGAPPRPLPSPSTSLEAWITIDPSPLPADVDPRLAAAIRRCLDPDPERRFASADELVDALSRIGADRAPAPVPEGNPYRGLAAFDAEHRALFFGRDAEILAVIDRLRGEPLVVVAGDSGVGKSSLCRAGVLPRVIEGALGDGRAYSVVSLVPGRTPLGALVAGTAPILGVSEEALAAALREDPGALGRDLRRALGKDRGTILLVDQLEELCTLGDPGEAALFDQVIARTATRAAGVRIVATVRGDYITRLAAWPGLGAELGRALYLLRPLSGEAAREAITGPARRTGVTFESDALVDALLASHAGAAGGLPLLQFALAELWEARDRDSGRISSAALTTIGGVGGALARHADAVLAAMTEPQREAARRIALRLVTSAGTRARCARAELEGDGETRENAGAALEAMIRGRLVVATEADGSTVYELVHETLIEGWGTLRRWREDEGDARHVRERIEAAAAEWVRVARAEDALYGERALVEAARVEAAALTAQAKAFVEASSARAKRSRRRRRLGLGAAVGLLAAMAVGATGAALTFAEKERQAIRQQEQIRLAAADMGIFELVLEPFDWDADRLVATPVSAPPPLEWKLHAVDAADATEPGPVYSPLDVQGIELRVTDTAIHHLIEARSGPAYLEIRARGGDCAPSWIYLKHLPGYADRAAEPRTLIRVLVPTCQASRAGTVEIPAGEFYRNVDAPKDDDPPIDEIASLPRFFIDRTEVTRAAFGQYASMEPLTGDNAAPAPHLEMNRPNAERLPIAGINYFTARSYCRFMGKELPTIEAWQKALRGGTTVNGAVNPAPKRDLPWVKATAATPANFVASEESDLALVGSYPDDTSPYGLVDMAGNVSEWSADKAGPARLRGLRVVLGGNWGSLPDLRDRAVTWRNTHPDRYLDFAIGVRCVADRASH
ncbi:MAG: SUMF1/EgtB/PvdO family nonheme iron enzyme [Byssovorax sp.]